MYPFPALWQATTATQDLVQLLESHENLLSYLDTFADKAVGFAFPFLPENLSRREVEHFLQDREQNGVMYPDLLALIFAASALGIQMGGGDSDMGEQEDRSRRGDVFSECLGPRRELRTHADYLSLCRNPSTSCFRIFKSAFYEELAGSTHRRSISHQQWKIPGRLVSFRSDHPPGSIYWPSSQP